MLIKNRTPYKGKVKILFEKYPEYTSSQSVLNKVHLNLGFTKLVSRIQLKREEKNGSIEKVLDPSKVALINMLTGGKIGKHEWWVVKGTNGNFETPTKPANEKDIVFYGCLENSFLSSNGDYIGDINRGWWYCNNNMVICEEYPHGVAVALKDNNYFLKYNRIYRSSDLNMDGDAIGYYGYTHRGGCLFKLGDRLFEEDYVPVRSDYTQEEWDEYYKKYQKALKKADDFDKECVYKDGIKSVMPFNKRGSKVIENWEEAKRAAINMSKYLS